jgi:hypothetical protein
MGSWESWCGGLKQEISLSMKGIPLPRQGVGEYKGRVGIRGSVFFPQVLSVPPTLSFHPLISKPAPRRVGQCAASLPGVSKNLGG